MTVPHPTLSKVAAEFVRQIAADRRAHAPCCLYAAATTAALIAAGQHGHIAFGFLVLPWTAFYFLFLPAATLLVVWCLCRLRLDRTARRLRRRRGDGAVGRPPSDRLWLALRLMARPARLARIAAGALLLASAMAFVAAFTAVKTTMSASLGFRYDVLLADIDKALHFGVDPWRLVAPLVESDAIRRLIGLNYSIGWFTVVFGSLFFVAMMRRADGIRTRFFLEFALVWVVLGNLVATIGVSAGPCFYAAVTGDTERFAPLTALIARGIDLPNSAAQYQAYLWALYTAGRSDLGSGISAFPSVHVAMATFLALWLAELRPRLAWIGVAFILVIQVSSVALGWHYAVDGYVSIVVVVLLHSALARSFRADGVRPVVRDGGRDVAAPGYG